MILKNVLHTQPFEFIYFCRNVIVFTKFEDKSTTAVLDFLEFGFGFLI
jgi:hypothetical protein